MPLSKHFRFCLWWESFFNGGHFSTCQTRKISTPVTFFLHMRHVFLRPGVISLRRKMTPRSIFDGGRYSSLHRLCSARLKASSGLMAEGVQTNNQRGQRSGPRRLWGGLDKARHIVPTAQCFRKGSYMAVEGPSTKPIVLSMITGSYCRRRRRLTMLRPFFPELVMSTDLLNFEHPSVLLFCFEPDEMKFCVSLTLLSL